MAFTATQKEHNVFGSLKVKIFDLDFDSVTGGKISTGFNTVLYANYVPGVSDDHGIVYVNYSDAGTTASEGDVYVDAVTSDDTGKLLVFGR